jgi:hypothetical protein
MVLGRAIAVPVVTVAVAPRRGHGRCAAALISRR